MSEVPQQDLCHPTEQISAVECGLGLIFKIAVRNSEYPSSCCRNTCIAEGGRSLAGECGAGGPRQIPWEVGSHE